MPFPQAAADVTTDDIAQIISSMTGIDVGSMTEEDGQKLLGLEHGIHRLVVGQATAVKALAKAVSGARVVLQDPNRPIGSFLFLEPTGVGETEVTRALAQELFGSAEMMTRIDMAEYGEQHSVPRLIGEARRTHRAEDQGIVAISKIRFLTTIGKVTKALRAFD